VPDPAAALIALKADRGVQSDVREVGGARHADAGVGRLHAALGGGDVGPALQQRCRQAAARAAA
jgi:hypothetical protein